MSLWFLRDEQWTWVVLGGFNAGKDRRRMVVVEDRDEDKPGPDE